MTHIMRSSWSLSNTAARRRAMCSQAGPAPALAALLSTLVTADCRTFQRIIQPGLPAPALCRRRDARSDIAHAAWVGGYHAGAAWRTIALATDTAGRAPQFLLLASRATSVRHAVQPVYHWQTEAGWLAGWLSFAWQAIHCLTGDRARQRGGGLQSAPQWDGRVLRRPRLPPPACFPADAMHERDACTLMCGSAAHNSMSQRVCWQNGGRHRTRQLALCNVDIQKLLSTHHRRATCCLRRRCGVVCFRCCS